jgi:hypothetical protein
MRKKHSKKTKENWYGRNLLSIPEYVEIKMAKKKRNLE